MHIPRLLSGTSKPLAARLFFRALTIAAAVLVLLFCASSLRGPRVQAEQENEHEREQSKIKIGFAIAPVPLNLEHKNRELVGLGSYIVNAQADCNGCHSRGPQTEYLPTGNPFLLPPPKGPYQGSQKINPQTYLGGGRDFGPVFTLNHLYSRNLTPDNTGLPEGGHTFREFLTIMRTGKDYDHVHPACSGAPDGTCLPAPFNADLLQIMPWPVQQNMTEHDLRAIYEYLSAIPCIDTVVDGAPYLRNNCS